MKYSPVFLKLFPIAMSIAAVKSGAFFGKSSYFSGFSSVTKSFVTSPARYNTAGLSSPAFLKN